MVICMTILLSIDGTGSSGWDGALRAGSHVKKLHDRHPGVENKDKFYLNGPDNFGIFTSTILSRGLFFLLGRVGWFKSAPGMLGLDVKTETIDLIGYSRGAAIAVELAWQLHRRGIKVRFLGLFDAVDRDIALTHTQRIPPNVRMAAHAMRDPKRESREAPVFRPEQPRSPSPVQKIGSFAMTMQSSTPMRSPAPMQKKPLTQAIQLPIGFGHTATEAVPKALLTKLSFLTTHGGMGGVHEDIADFDPQATAADAALRQKFGFDRDLLESASAFDFVRTEAERAGVFAVSGSW